MKDVKISIYKTSYKHTRTKLLSGLMKELSSSYGQMCYDFRRQTRLYGLDEESVPEEKCPPLIFFSSCYKKENNRLLWTSYTGIVAVTIARHPDDKEEEKQWMKLKLCPQTLAYLPKLTGQRLVILTAFRLPDNKLPKTQEAAERFHAHALRQTSHFYSMLLGLPAGEIEEVPMDQGIRWPNSYQKYFNPEVTPIRIEQPLSLPPVEETVGITSHIDTPRLLPGWKQEDEAAFLFDIALRETYRHWEERGFSAADKEAEGFLITLAENCFRTGIPEEEAVKRARFYSVLGDREHRVRAVIRNAYALGKGFGERPAIPAAQRLIIRLEEFMARRYEIRRNRIKKVVEYRERAALFFPFRAVTEEGLNTISMQAHHEGLEVWDRDVRRYIHSNRIATYDPIDDYLDHLPVWDGGDHIRMLARSLPTENPHWENCFYRWFLGMVAQWKGVNRMHGNCIVPLLTGPQSAGKSTWCKQILPPELSDYYAESLDLSSRRNAELSLSRFALINLDEFDAIPAGKHPLLKHLLQLPEVSIRRAHQSHVETLPRYASFIGTCNPMDVLTDPTGSRRYLAVEVSARIDLEQSIDYPQLYAQAIAALRQEERYWLDTEEEKQITQYNENFSRRSIEEQLLIRYYRPATLEEPHGEWLSAIEIMEDLQKRGRFKPTISGSIHFGRLLKKHHFPRRHTDKGNLYHIIRREEDDTA